VESTLATTLDQLATAGVGERAVVGTLAPNMGNRTITARFPVAELNRISVVANGGPDAPEGEEIAQRALDQAHATKLAQFILRGLVNATIQKYTDAGAESPQALTEIGRRLGKQPYFSLPPIIANLRGVGPKGQQLRASVIRDGGSESAEVVAIRFWLRQDHLLYVIDGQHRRKAIEVVMDFLEGDVIQRRRYSRKNIFGNDGIEMNPDELRAWNDVYSAARADALITVEIHLDLSIEQERQLFHDTNNLGKKVAPSLALAFDSANPVNRFIKERLIENGLVHVADRDIVVGNWDADDGVLSRKDLVAVNAHLFLNKSNIKGAKVDEVERKIPVALRFWRAIIALPGFGALGARGQTVAAQPVVLKALAKLAYDLSFGRQAHDGFRDRLLSGISQLDLTHSNPMWGYYSLSPQQRAEAGLAQLGLFLPPDDSGVNRDLGGRDSEGRFRFGAKHNDIIPILGDMIRWSLRLPTRHATHVDI
jgi:hypothetical protein